MYDFNQSVIVVTGAAGNLGSAVVKKFLNVNAIVCGLDHRSGRVEKIFAGSPHGGLLHCFDGVDLTDRENMVNLAKRIADEVGPVEVVVNTVGGFTAGERVHEISADTWHRMMDLNVQSFLNTSAAFIPSMLEEKRGKVITIGSGASLKGSGKTGVYAAAKGALLRLTESMAAELKAHHIQVNCVLPGTIDTPENRQAMPDLSFDNWVTPEQIADAILFLSSSASDAITGAALPVTGKS